MDVTSIRIIETKRNLAEVIGAITWFDNMISGGSDFKYNPKYCTVIRQLYKLYLNNSEAQMDPYLLNTLNTFRQTKQKICIDVESNGYSDQFTSLLFESFDWE